MYHSIYSTPPVPGDVGVDHRHVEMLVEVERARLEALRGVVVSEARQCPARIFLRESATGHQAAAPGRPGTRAASPSAAAAAAVATRHRAAPSTSALDGIAVLDTASRHGRLKKAHEIFCGRGALADNPATIGE